jgi:hypothetical protein
MTARFARAVNQEIIGPGTQGIRRSWHYLKRRLRDNYRDIEHLKIKKIKGRVEDRLAPALPHQTVHAVFPHTAFRCSSRQGMHKNLVTAYHATEYLAQHAQRSRM